MKSSKSSLIILIILFMLLLSFFLKSVVFGFSTNPTTTYISRSFDKIRAFRTESIIVTVSFENNEVYALRGFYYVDHIPQRLTVDTFSVKVDGNYIFNYNEELNLAGDINPGTIQYRWILETPSTFNENNPIGIGSILEIVYSISSDQLGTFNLDEFHWVGYYQEAVEGQCYAFGYSEDTDKQMITFVNTLPMASNDSAITSEDTSVIIDVLVNDSDPDGSIDPSTLLLLTEPMNGNTDINSDWTITYTPLTNFTGTDNFTYTVQDNDGAFSNEAIITVLVNLTLEANSPPVLEAGPDQTITLPNSAFLNGTVTDDGVPNPPGVVTTTWSKVSGIGTVTFADISALDTTASFSESGTYVLRLTADDGEFIASDDTTITVNSEPDLTPPTPDPMTWQTAPHATGAYSISMTATTATDPSGVEYYFECISVGGNDSLWQDSPTYEDTGLQPDIKYIYRVKTRDKSSNQNENNWSPQVSANTDTASAEVRILGSWVSGMSHAKEPGHNRALLFTAHSEDLHIDLNLSSISYGGQPMMKVIERNVGSSVRAYVVTFILDEAGIAAATGDFFSPIWTPFPARIPAYSSVFLENVNQAALLGDMDSNGTTSSTLTTNALFTNPGDMVVMAGTCGNEGTYSVNNNFTEAIEILMSFCDGVAGYKSANGIAEIPSITHSNVDRQVIIAFVLQAGVSFEPDLDPPAPDPMTWQTAPHATGAYSISMTATTATDPSGVEYYFECIAGGETTASGRTAPHMRI